jgi:hypothetical protein
MNVNHTSKTKHSNYVNTDLCRLKIVWTNVPKQIEFIKQLYVCLSIVYCLIQLNVCLSSVLSDTITCMYIYSILSDTITCMFIYSVLSDTITCMFI